ncbi:MAG: hypothetical protein ABMA64_13950 [Myxococcota bacterium]
MVALAAFLLCAAPAGAADGEPVFPGQVAPGSPNYDLEEMYYQSRLDEGLKLAKQRLASAPTAQLHWMKARFMYEIGEGFLRTDTTIDKEAWYSEMLATANAGLKLAPGDPHLRFARGIAMGRLGTTRGILQSLFMADDVEADWLVVANDKTFRYASIGGVEALPCDAYHALGIYYRLVPDWWIVEMVAGTRGDLDQAIAYNRKSIECKPDEVENWKELGASQLCKAGNGDAALKAEGLASLRHALTLPAPRPRNQLDQKHSKMLIDDPSLACEYSRDGQQDLDEKKLQASQ